MGIRKFCRMLPWDWYIYLHMNGWFLWLNGLVNIPYTWILLAYGWLEPRDIFFGAMNRTQFCVFFPKSTGWLNWFSGSDHECMPPPNKWCETATPVFQVGMQASLSLWVLDDLVCSCQTCQCHTLPCMSTASSLKRILGQQKTPGFFRWVGEWDGFGVSAGM